MKLSFYELIADSLENTSWIQFCFQVHIHFL